MIRGKYLRERKAMRIKRRIKLLIIFAILLVLYKLIFSSYSLYESEANSSADIDVAFYLLKDDYKSKVIALDDMIPGSTQKCEFSISNYYVDDEGNDVISETDMEYTLKIRTTTNLPLEYKLYMNQSADNANSDDIIEIPIITQDEDATYFKQLVEDKQEFPYTQGYTNTYTLVIEFPEEFKGIEYQDIIECIEISIDSKQIID